MPDHFASIPPLNSHDKYDYLDRKKVAIWNGSRLLLGTEQNSYLEDSFIQIQCDIFNWSNCYL